MPVLINFKICDNAKECGGIEVCPAGALFWDSKKKSVAIDNKKCKSCGKCKKACPVGAISVAKSEKEYREEKKEIDQDKRKRTDLFIDRYGAQPIHTAFLISEKRFDSAVLGWEKLIAAELFSNDSIMCLLKSIPIKKLFSGYDIDYRKVKTEEGLMKRFGIKELPALLFFENGKLLGKIDGYYDNKKEKILFEKISKIIKKKKS